MKGFLPSMNRGGFPQTDQEGAEANAILNVLLILAVNIGLTQGKPWLVACMLRLGDRHRELGFLLEQGARRGCVGIGFRLHKILLGDGAGTRRLRR